MDGKNGKYSVLMSVYNKEIPEYLDGSMDSMWNQTIPVDDFVLVCDGPLNPELEQVIQEQKQSHGETLQVVRLEEGQGLGKALNYGMQFCKHEIIARMDSDDISKPERMEKQLEAMEKYQADLVGSAVDEFEDNIENVKATRRMVETSEEIRKYIGKRNPFNHPTMVYVKSAVLQAGGYMDCPFFEDYYLWARMIQAGKIGYNVPESLLYMRAGAKMYQRRGGLAYGKLAFKFRRKLRKMGVSSFGQYVVSAYGQFLVCLIPNFMREFFYQKFLRKK